MIMYYTEYYDSFGRKHYAVQAYQKSTGFIISMKDIKF
jgi:hypothetical protein